jgi:hypothetical protein
MITAPIYSTVGRPTRLMMSRARAVSISMMMVLGITAVAGVCSELYVEREDGGSQACGRFPVWTLVATVAALSAVLVLILTASGVATFLVALGAEGASGLAQIARLGPAF